MFFRTWQIKIVLWTTSPKVIRVFFIIVSNHPQMATIHVFHCLFHWGTYCLHHFIISLSYNRSPALLKDCLDLTLQTPRLRWPFSGRQAWKAIFGHGFFRKSFTTLSISYGGSEMLQFPVNIYFSSLLVTPNRLDGSWTGFFSQWLLGPDAVLVLPSI